MNKETQSVVGHTIYALAICGFLFSITGFAIIMATRLFTKWGKLPSIRECLYVGLAVWWGWWLFLVPKDNSTPKEVHSMHVKGYDYDIKDNRIEYVHAPTKDEIIGAHWLPSKTGKYINPLIYVIGVQNSKNKVFHISTTENKITRDDFGEGRGKYISVTYGKGGRRLAVSKPYNTNYYNVSLTLFSILFFTLGTLGFLSAQLRAFNDASTG